MFHHFSPWNEKIQLESIFFLAGSEVSEILSEQLAWLAFIHLRRAHTGWWRDLAGGSAAAGAVAAGQSAPHGKTVGLGLFSASTNHNNKCPGETTICSAKPAEKLSALVSPPRTNVQRLRTTEETFAPRRFHSCRPNRLSRTICTAPLCCQS